MEGLEQAEKISATKVWMPFIGFISKWLILGTLATFSPWLIHNIEVYAGSFIYISAILWLLSPASAVAYYFFNNQKTKALAKLHYWIWGIVTSWAWLSPTVLGGKL